MKKKSLFLMLFMLLSIKTIFGQWTINGPEGALVLCIYNSGNELYAGTSLGIYKSIDEGNTWINISNLGNNTYIQKIIKSNGKLYAVSNYTVYRSSDDGMSWETLSFNNNYITSIINVNTTILISTYQGIYQSYDEGITWTKTVSGIDNTYGYFIFSINYNPVTGLLYAAHNWNLYVSSDLGNSWTVIPNSPPAVLSMSFNNNLIITTGSGGVFCIISQDGGQTWQNISNTSGSSGISVVKVNSDYYILTYRDGLYKSSDNGNTWVAQNILNSREFNQGISCTANYLLIGGRDGIQRLSINNSGVWTEANNGLTDSFISDLIVHKNTVIAMSSGNIYSSADEGLTWNLKNNNLVESGANKVLSANNTLFVTTNKGIYKSTDDGNSWVAINNGLDGFNTIYSNIKIINNVLYVWTSSGLYKSLNNGASWQNSTGNLVLNYYATSIQNIGSDIYLGTLEGIYKSADGGSTWMQINNGLSDVGVESLLSYNNILYAGTGSGLFYSIDQGISWVKVGVLEFGVSDIKIYNNQIYITGQGGIYKVIPNDDCYQFYQIKNDNYFYTNSILFYNNKVYSGGNDINNTKQSGVFVSNFSDLVPLNPIPVTSPIIGNTSICTTNIQSYSVTNVPGNFYTWTIPSGATIISGDGTNSITVDFSNSTGIISVTEHNGSCAGQPVNLTVTKSSLNSTNNITGNATICANALNQVYSVPNNTGSTYAWSVPSDYTITAGQGTNSITVNIGISTGNISVTETTAANCTAMSSPFTVTPTAGPTLTSISGPSTFCAGQFAELYTALPAISGATYVWTATSSLAPTSQLLNKAAFQFSPAVASYTLTAHAMNAAGCAGNAVTTTLTRKLNLSAVSGPATICSYSTNSYSVLTDDPNAYYIWTPSSNANVTAGNGTSQISLNLNATTGTNLLSVSEVDNVGCSSNTQQLSIAIKAYPIPVFISGIANVCPNQTGVQYTATNAAASFTCNWTVPSGATIVSGQGTKTISVDYANFNTAGTISVNVVQPLACSNSSAVFNVNGTQTTTGTISGASKVCANAQLVPYSVPYHVGSTYSWTVPAHAFIISTGAQGTNISVSYNNFVSGNITVTETLPGGCSIAPLTLAVSSASVSSNYVIPAVNVSCNSGTFDILVNTVTPISSGVISFEIGFSYDPRVITPVASGTKYTPGPVLTSVGAGNLTHNIFNSSLNASTSTLIYTVYTNSGTFSGAGNVVALRFNVNSSAHVGDYTPLSIMALIEGLSTGGQNSLCPANIGLVSIVSQETVLHGQVLLNSTTTPLGYDAANTSSYLPTTIAGSLSSACGTPSVSTLPDLAGKFTYDITNGNYLSINRDINNSTIVTGYLNGYDALRVALIAVGQVVPTVYDILAADVDLSGVVTGNDAQFVLNRVVSGSYTSQNRTTPLDWVFIDNTTLNTPPFKKSLTYPLDDMVGFSPTHLPVYSLCMPVRQVSNSSCTDIPDEIYRGILIGDVAAPKFTNTPGSKLKTSGISAANGYTSFYSNGSLVIDLSKAKMTSQGTYLIPLSQLAGDTAQAFDIDLDYNENEITILSVTNADQSIKYAWNNFNGKQLLVSGYSLEAIKEGSVLYYLEVTANSNMSVSGWGTTFRAMVNGATVEGVIKTPDTNSSQDALTNLSMYPNPASDKVYLSDVPSEFTVEIRNLTGELVYSGHNESEMTVSSFSAGLYILIVKSESGTRRFKFNKLK